MWVLYLDYEKPFEVIYFVELLNGGAFGANVVAKYGNNLEHYYGNTNAVIDQFKLRIGKIY
jgi:hypothetical protein